MTITRRIFMSGLAALLPGATITTPSSQHLDEGPEAKEVKVNADGQTMEEIIDNLKAEPVYLVEYLEVGECEEMMGGPAKKSGWYLHPGCMIGCCPSKGPYACQEDAEEVFRLTWECIVRESFA